MKSKIQLVVILFLALFCVNPYLPKAEKLELEAEELVETSPSYEWFAEQIAQLERAQAQEFFAASKARHEHYATEAQAVQARLEQEILKLQLQLVLVSLDNQEQQVVLERINLAHQEFETWQKQAQAELEQDLVQLQAEHHLRLQKTLAVLTSP